MNRRPSELALVAVSLVCVLILAACNCAPTLRYITISPSGPTIAAGAQEAFTATGYYSNGAVTPNISVSWSSSNTSVATINGTSGVATGVAAGTTTITATALGITSGTTTLTVAAPTSITVTPATATISATGSSNTQQFDAVANYTGGSQDVTAFATWATTTAGIATFSTTTPGLATAVAAGTTQVTATLNGVVGTASLTVTPGTTLVITPATPNLAVGNAIAVSVQEQYPDMSLHPVSNPVTWSSATAAQANVVVQPGATNNSAAIVAAFAVTPTAGVVITATEGALTGNTTITVDQGTTHYAYVANSGSPSINIQSYTVTASASPYLAPLATTNTPDGTSPLQNVIDPNGQYMFVTSTGPSSTEVTPYAIAANGSLTPGAPVPMTPTTDLTYTLIDPYGRFLFVADQSTPSATGGIYVFTINQTSGVLTLVNGSPFTSNLNIPAGLAVDQSGTYLYVSNFGFPPSAPNTPGTTIAGFQINSTTGALTPLSTPTFTNALNAPAYVAWDPTGTYLYVANNNNGTVSSFTLGSGGALSALTTTTVTGSQALLNLAVSPNGSYLYVLDAGGISTTNGALYGFTLTSGKPSSSPIGSSTPVGDGPTGIAIDPTSSLLAVDNSGSNYINIFTIGSTGALTAPSTPTVATGAAPYFVTFYNTF